MIFALPWQSGWVQSRNDFANRSADLAWLAETTRKTGEPAKRFAKSFLLSLVPKLLLGNGIFKLLLEVRGTEKRELQDRVPKPELGNQPGLEHALMNSRHSDISAKRHPILFIRNPCSYDIAPGVQTPSFIMPPLRGFRCQASHQDLL